MKKIIFLIVIVLSTKAISQNEKESFIGEIQTEVKTVFTDEDLYYTDVEKYLRIMDSIMIKEYNENPNSKYLKQYPNVDSYRNSAIVTYKIALDPRFTGRNWIIPKLYKHTFSDSMVKIEIPKSSTLTINRQSLNVKGQKRINTEFKEVPVKYQFNEVAIDNIEIDKNDKKVIAGIECFKVKIIQKGERVVRHFYWNNLKDSKIITEMYVTDKIKTHFNTIVKNKLILEKFYPMYVKRYSTAFRGIHLTSKVISLEEKK